MSEPRAEPRQLEVYTTEDGKVPYEDWLDALKDRKTRDRIMIQIARMRLGNLGHCRAVGDGVIERILNFGPGYRVYFAQAGAIVVLLLCGGDKNSQKADIAAAKNYWADYQAQRKEMRSYAKANEKLYRPPG